MKDHNRPIADLAIVAVIIAAWPFVVVAIVGLLWRYGWRGLSILAVCGLTLPASAFPAPRQLVALAEDLPGEWYLEWGNSDYRAAFTADGGYHWCGCAHPFQPVDYDLRAGGWRVLSESRGVYQLAVREGQGWFRWELSRTADGWAGKFWRAHDQDGEAIDNAWREVRLKPLRRHPEWIKFAAGRID